MSSSSSATTHRYAPKMRKLFAVAHNDELYDTSHIDHLPAPAYISAMQDLARTSKQIGAIIQRTRKARGWTQMQLAEQAGLRQATISIIESGDRPAKLDTILAVLAALDLEFRVEPRSKGSDLDIEELF
ncbi:helix-turn-helix protein [Celeribacter halophilus]|uniref:Helix-turn-helix n=2 Tax=Celeribacter halophilus TaxID=576117 RepID=A0A1I3R335_9RHOB|nr:helix-turn-helix protein [Celeribacter halophilus]SFJ40768.1 Helix-turn-helix [Celeribacter halophilus]